MNSDGVFIAVRTMRSLRVVVMSERLAFYLGVGQKQEPILIDAFRPRLAVEALDKLLSVGFPGREKSSVTPFA